MYAALNGELREAAELGVSTADRGLTLGDGAFETVAVRGGRARRVDAHLARLADGLATLGFTNPPPAADLRATIDRVITANGMTDGVLRLTVTRGAAARGLAPAGPETPTVLVTASAGLPTAAPVEAITSARVRRNEHSPASRVKSLSYLDNVLARREAAEHGAGEAVLLNTAGRVAEAAVANLVAVIDGAAVTPPLAEGALPGVIRAEALRRRLVWERPITPAELKNAGEIVLTNALTVRWLTALDDAAAGAEIPGRLAETLIRLTDEV